jgi:Uma2 family endonuclease
MNLSQMQYYKEQKGYSLDKLSELSGVPRGTLQKIFSGETRNPRYETLQAIEAVLMPEDPYRVASLIKSGSLPDGEQESGDYLQDIENRNKLSAVAEATPVYEAKKKKYTLDDYYALPDDQRVELIDGVFYDMGAPSTYHQIVCLELGVMLKNYIKNKGGSCIPIASPVDVQLDCDNKTMVQPDVLVLCDRSKLIKRCIYGAPDFIIEVISKSTKRKDTTIKLSKYIQAGVREFWLVDIEKERVLVYFFESDDYPTIYGRDDEIPVGIFDGELKIPMAEVFGALEGL